MSTHPIPHGQAQPVPRTEAAWRAVVAEHGPRIWAVTRAYRLGHADAADVFQATLLNLAEHLDTVRDPAGLRAWLVTTAKRECLRVLALRRPLPVRWVPPEPPESPEDHVLADARDAELWRAFRGLSPRCRRLLRLFAYAPEMTYAELADAVGIHPGSVGQTKGRCLAALRRRLGGAR